MLPLGFIGTVAGLKDLDGYRAMLRRSRAIGFACASCVHPSQVAIINEEYGARPEEVERASASSPPSRPRWPKARAPSPSKAT